MPDQDKPAPKPKPIEVTYDGETYTYVPDELPLAAWEAIDAEKFTIALRIILGDVQWEKYRSTHPLAKDLNDFLQAIMKAAPNPSASPVS